MPTFKNCRFINERVPLDGNVYQDCEFQGCKLVYSGSELPVLEGCTFDECIWGFAEAAGRTAAFIRAVAQAMGPEGRRFIENTFLDQSESGSKPSGS